MHHTRNSIRQEISSQEEIYIMTFSFNKNQVIYSGVETTDILSMLDAINIGVITNFTLTEEESASKK